MDEKITKYLNDKEYHYIGHIYYWHYFKSFNLFLRTNGTWEVVLHQRLNGYLPIEPDGVLDIRIKFPCWSSLPFDCFMQFIGEIELLDKQISLEEKFKSIQEDF